MNRVWSALKENPGKGLIVLLSLQVLLHLPFLNLPPCSIHVWRQCNTLAVSRNFFEEDNRILLPRVDRRGDQSGVTGMSFPAYEWLLAQIYRFAGTENAVHRGFSLLISLVTLVAAAACFRYLSESAWLGVACAWAIAWSPEFFYQSINALPDVLALASAFLALWAGLAWRRHRTIILQCTTMLLLTLAGLIKMQYGLFGVFLGALLLHDHLRVQPLQRSQSVVWLLGGCISLLTVLAWYRYANTLTEASLLTDFVLTIRPVTDLTAATAIVIKNILSDLPELLLNYANMLFFLIGIWAFIAFKHQRRDWLWPLLAAVCLQFIWYVLMLEQMRVHQYYLLPFLLISTPLVLIGIRYLDQSKWAGLLAMLLLVQPVLAAARILPARWLKTDLGIPAEFADPEQLDILQKKIPDPKHVIAGPDRSGCIWLYFLHAKGFTFDETRQLFETDADGPDLERYTRQGARWLVIREGELSEAEAKRHQLELHARVGRFEVYRIN
ncbi:MAG: ArnT family glycosyltransferase [Bacteroidota bacterium]